MQVQVGDKLKVPTDKQRYTVQARDERYVICTKPFNLAHTVLYFIADLKEKRRGPDDRIFCSAYETQEDCQERLRELQNGEIRLSTRYSINLDVDIE